MYYDEETSSDFTACRIIMTVQSSYAKMVKPDDGDCGLLVHLLLYVYASALQKEWSGETRP
ncbi:hypothetical protein B0F90DRAFT_1742473 [Multifurca ochricompacta]|uniref:Uncharacterized protein n=1 Tax=Multifurca ochricompacta TaxID=376703 RepID=A0AAD4M0P1_9AGAM|nr:hypothetical protein B0F90DRAFT_1742473 [Multifurca ochricompacta]